MATEADLIQKFKDLNIPVGSDFEELIHEAFIGANLADKVESYDSRITTVENSLDAAKGSIQANTDQLATKVTDNHDGTEQLNGVQVHPFNKLSDTVGGRNLLPISNYSSGYVKGADGSIVTADGTAKEVVSAFVPVDITQSYYCQIIEQVNNNQVWFGIGFYDNNKQFISRYGFGSATVTGTITSVIRMLPAGFPNISIPNVYTAVFPANTAYVRISFRTYGNQIQASLEKSSVLSDWTPAPEDKADDSKVVHNSGNEEIAGQKTFDTAPIDKTTGTPYSTQSDVTTAISAATSDAAYISKDNNFLGDLQYKGNEVATTNLLQNFYQADDDNTARQKAESLTNPGFVWFSENEIIPVGTILSTNGTGYSTDLSSDISLTDNLLADFSNVPNGIQLNFSSDVWLNTISAKIGALADFKITPTTMQIPKASIYASSSSNAIYLPLPTVTSITYKSTNYTVDKSQANCNIYNNGGVLKFNRILGGFGSGDTTHYYLLGIDSITAY